MLAYPRSTIIVSPHVDDAIYSLGAAIHAGELGRVHIANVFSRSRWTLSGLGDPTTITETRQLEEERVCAMIDCTFENLGLPDSSLLTSDRLFTEDRVSEAREIILGLISSHHWDAYYFPVGNSQHPDHVIVSSIGWQRWKENPRTGVMAFYEEIPYQALSFLDERALVQFGFSRMVRGGAQLEGKLACLRQYRSQFGRPEETEVVVRFRRNAGEVTYVSGGTSISLVL